MHTETFLFLSHRLDTLLDSFIEKTAGFQKSPLQSQIVLVPNGFVKQWFLLEIAKRKTVAMGLKLLTVQEAIPLLFQERGKTVLFPNFLEMLCLVYTELADSKDSELIAYLDGNPKRLRDLAEQMASFFFVYGQFGRDLFEFQGETKNWQEAILEKIFVSGNWRLPVQLTSAGSIDLNLHCFAIDFLPPLFWQQLFRCSSLSIYLFSPCQDFWEDTRTDRERKNLKRYWKKRGISSRKLEELDGYLREGPSLLLNWGKLGRETLKIFQDAPLQIEEAYPALEGASLLKKIQADLLYFKTSEEIREVDEGDDSIQVSQTGSSRLREIEVLRDSILALVSEKGILFSDISILAPDIGPYAPLIEFVFSDPMCVIPYRIFGVDIGSQSSFLQGLLRLVGLGQGRWEAEDVLTLFETPSFSRKQKWAANDLERLREWVEKAHIRWGINRDHRHKVLQEMFGDNEDLVDEGSWEQGIEQLLDHLVYLFQESSSLQEIQINPKELEDLFLLFQALQADLAPFQQTLSLFQWAQHLEFIADKYLSADMSDEADSAAVLTFRQLIQDLRQADPRLENKLFPFAIIQRLLVRPCTGQIHSSYMHAVRIASIEEGACLPAKAVFVIGMDEESFPKAEPPSSLDLLRERKEFIPGSLEKGRYFFLQALFAAQEFFRVSFGHLSADEGKPVGPSVVLQELLSYARSSFALKQDIVKSHPALSFDLRCLKEKVCYSRGDWDAAKALYGPKKELSLWPDLSVCPPLDLPEGELTISISDLSLLARHPWKFYLQKVHSIFLDTELEDSFSLQKTRLLRASLKEPLEKIFTDSELHGVFGSALLLEVEEKSNEWKERLNEWGIKELKSLSFFENSSELSPIEILWENRLKVRIVGEIRNASDRGFVLLNEDNIGGVLKVWPEILVTGIALQKNSIFCLKSGKIRTVENLQENLKSYLEYYFRCLQAPSPLLVDWADAFLRKGPVELEKKIQTTLSGRDRLEDPVVEWVLARGELPSAEKMVQQWGSYLKETFSGLSALYPTRAAKGESHAAL